MTHVLRREENIFGDNQAFVEEWDFSRANLNEENRLNAITRVASICYQSPKALGSESLYNRLASESGGLPSSSFEFVPVVLDYGNISAIHMLDDININVRKFGEWVIVYDEIAKEDREVLLTNYRAVLYDFENRKEQLIKQYQQEDMSQESLAAAIAMLEAAYLKFFNTEMECDWIKQHFKVFLYKVDFPTRSQMVRHRINWQELSRRYVSGERVKFDFYISENMKPIVSHHNAITKDGVEVEIMVDMQDIIDICVGHYREALDEGVKPQDARRIIPQAGYTLIWGAFQPKYLKNFYKIRLDKHAQWEIRQIAAAMKGITNEVKL